jgi:alkanesulfonate monooxygenase SsuD/methylene tetrahydromethanopterin reductase-like flavin-dependent oxidoreductase (luciferase family)
MKYGLTLPIFDQLASPTLLAEFAEEAQEAGWDGIFVWDHVYYRAPARQVTDPWIAMAAMALRTSSIALGPMVTPLARRRPQVVARQVAALDQLSNGRLILGVGLGLDSSGSEFSRFGEEPEVRRRAAIYDEALDLVLALLSGEPVDHDGEHFKAADVRFLPTPVQPHLPVWVAGKWPNRRPLDRAARHQGAFIVDLEPGDVPAVLAQVASQRAGGLDGFDLVVQARPGTDPRPWEAAGATWLLTSFDPFEVSPAQVRDAIRRRPGPR